MKQNHGGGKRKGPNTLEGIGTPRWNTFETLYPRCIRGMTLINDHWVFAFTVVFAVQRVCSHHAINTNYKYTKMSMYSPGVFTVMENRGHVYDSQKNNHVT
mmetsp:Transcript_21782/g.26648  ORF Transcript_21782/g.26648 Transcript_21782/m.26648 type:complete len:101 (+) Transcript_21782:94-396(+)